MGPSLSTGRAGNMPAEVTSFIGRRHELAEVKELVRRARLITLTGLGGVGKTRLALETGRDLQDDFSDGVWLVELAGLEDSALVGQSVAAAFGLVEAATVWSLGALSTFLADRDLLIVLDNCEHLLDACAVMADGLLRTCPRVRILATSRQPLRIPAEFCVEVAPFDVDTDIESSAGDRGLLNDAVALFVDRAAAVRPGFSLNDENVATIRQICRRVDGIPLAIELAAGRMRALSITELLRRLEHRFELLIGGSRAALPRQQTLKSLIDWSYELLGEEERLLWTRLSVFSDGFTLSSAEFVCSDDALPASGLVDVLSGLVEKSIVSAVLASENPRYRLPETLREYAGGLLRERPDERETRARARDWIVGLTSDLQRRWFGPDQPELLDRLRAEHGNLRSALEYCLSDERETNIGLSIAADLQFYWLATGRTGEGRRWLERLLAQDHSSTSQRVRALCVKAYLMNGPAEVVGEVDRTLDEAEQILQVLADEESAAFVATVRGLAHLFRGQPELAETALMSAVCTQRSRGATGLLAYDLSLLSMAQSLNGSPDASHTLAECLTLCVAADERWIRSIALWTLGLDRCRAGDLDGSVEAQRESLRLRLPLGLSYLIALNLDALGWVAVEAEEHRRAARLFGAAEAIMRDVGAVVVSHGPTSPQHRDYELRAQLALGRQEFETAFNDGLAMGMNAAVDYALGGSHRHPKSTVLSDNRVSEKTLLTPREYEVAKLVAQGLSNRRIASTLVISQRTAEGHVEHVLTKLGFTSRAQIASWITTQEHTTA